MNFSKKLTEQLEFIETSCRAYDDGRRSEAVRIAVSAANIMYTSKSSTSLLMHLGAEDVRLRSTCTRPPNPKTGMLYHALTQIEISLPYVRHKPKMDIHGSTAVPFLTWWEREIIIWTPRIFRKDLIKVARNQDGGAHVDANLEEIYAGLAVGGGSLELIADLETTAGPLKGGFKAEDVHYAALRQIGYEILISEELHRLTNAG